MGCRSSKSNDGAIKVVQSQKKTEIRKTDENFHPHNKENSEYSLRDCSLIAVREDDRIKRHASDDPSIVGIIQEIHSPPA